MAVGGGGLTSADAATATQLIGTGSRQLSKSYPSGQSITKLFKGLLNLSRSLSLSLATLSFSRRLNISVHKKSLKYVNKLGKKEENDGGKYASINFNLFIKYIYYFQRFEINDKYFIYLKYETDIL